MRTKPKLEIFTWKLPRGRYHIMILLKATLEVVSFTYCKWTGLVRRAKDAISPITSLFKLPRTNETHADYT